jgi:cobalt/nickel transport system permease protein
MIQPPLAVHISDGMIVWPWLAAGFAVAAALLFVSSRRVHEDEIPRIGLLTAAFFVASLIHVRAGPTSVHLLLNGLVGIILGGRAVLAITVALILQFALLGHGGYTALGLNIVIMSTPALLARPLFLHSLRAQETPSLPLHDGVLAVAYLLHPRLSLPLFFATFLYLRHGWRWRLSNDFRAGFLVGATCVMLTAFLNAIVLVVAGAQDWRIIAGVALAAHVPIAFIEGFIVGCTVGYLRRVKPEMLP